MGTTGTPEVQTAPYMPFPALEKFVRSLKGTALPDKIDRSLMSKMSGGVQAQLRATLRYFSLVDALDAPTPQLRAWIEAIDTPSAKSVLSPIVSTAYAELTRDLQLGSATTGQLETAFREKGGVSGSALTKAARFFLAAHAAAGIAVSPHFRPPRRSSAGAKNNGKPKPSRDTPGGASPQVTRNETLSPPDNVRELQIALPSRSVKVWIPNDLDTEELEYVMQQIEGYVKLAKRVARTSHVDQ